jgi:hypothetical protein
MAEQENKVSILTWPDEYAKLEHQFKSDEPCPVSISFEEKPAHVVIHTNPKEPMHVDMNMNVLARDTFPVCIKLCEPICVESEYKIGINIFDNPLASITVKGLTKLFNCKDQAPAEPICVDFHELGEGKEYTEPLIYENLTFTPLGDEIRVVSWGDPPGRLKIAFPREGLRIDFQAPVDNPRLTVNNYAGDSLDFFVYAGGTLIHEFTEPIDNEVKEISIVQAGVTAIEIKGGKNEASVIEVCYFPV